VKLETKLFTKMLNQIFEIEKKSDKLSEENTISRNISKLKDIFEDEISPNFSFSLRNPLNEKYDDTRTDLNADISGESTENLVVVEVIKPIIYIRESGKTQILQKGLVVVQDENTIKKPLKKSSKISTENLQTISKTVSKKKDRKGIRQARKNSPSKQSKQSKRR
jgi:hypothetical protein